MGKLDFYAIIAGKVGRGNGYQITGMVPHQTKCCKKLITDEKKTEVKRANNSYYLSSMANRKERIKKK